MMEHTAIEVGDRLRINVLIHVNFRKVGNPGKRGHSEIGRSISQAANAGGGPFGSASWPVKQWHNRSFTDDKWLSNNTSDESKPSQRVTCVA